MNKFFFFLMLPFFMVSSLSLMAKKSAKKSYGKKSSKKKRVVLITGASSGIGKSTAVELHKRGYVVYAAARSLGKMEDLRSKGIHVVKLDITDETMICSCVAEVIRNQGRIDVLINNAGVGVYGSAEETTIEDARYQFEVNLFGLARLTQLVIPYMRKQKSGTIVNISSVVGKIYMPLASWYVASKHALEGWSDCLRVELKQFGIKVIVIEPGIIKTNFGSTLHGPMMKRSAEGPYKKFVVRVNKHLNSKKPKFEGSKPSVIALVVAKSLERKKPCTRYAAGKYAKILLFLRKWISDKLYDWIVLSQFKK